MNKVDFDKNKCIVCEQNKDSGIILYNSFICIDCESDIINTQTNNPKYKYYVEKLSKIKQSHHYIK